MRFSFQGEATIAFDCKPPAEVLQILKRNGFRWSPAANHWYRRRITGASDVVAAIRHALEPRRPDGRTVRPDGQCWRCGADGWFRNYGAAAPVLCDECAAKRDEAAAQ